MKQRYTLLLPTLSMAILVSAQPSIDASTYGPMSGDAFLIHSVGDQPNPQGGSNATWNYSTLSLDPDPSTLQYSAPLSGDPAAATVYSSSGSSTSRTFFRVDADGYTFLGTEYGTIGSAACTQPRTLMPLPFAMGDQRTDSYQCTTDFAGSVSTSAGTTAFNAIGYGTLILPYGNISNVLLVEMVQTQDLNSSSGLSQSIAEAYFFLKPGVHYPVLTVRTDSTITSGDVYHFTFMLDQTDVGIREAMSQAIGIDLFPNPASGTVDLVCGTMAAGEATVQVVDQAGRTARQTMLRVGTPGVQREALDLTGLAAGLYTVLVTDAQGAFGSKRMIVQ